ncbi:hypothetical protein PAXRUDRAFT_825349 [Paxillus rubicundulus Ve08.2h10]|uniref:Uncharacterized protein n=1 Tax=Paxillus rubicundulus Ve08.2h10 TaxID=930991 RepID=A0A0D0EB10_9AGAM|nr:hypothetical protein PAXRUDRAFT_825349 [Paxillus rubicundulus Ve08.2h10]
MRPSRFAYKSGKNCRPSIPPSLSDAVRSYPLVLRPCLPTSSSDREGMQGRRVGF